MDKLKHTKQSIYTPIGIGHAHSKIILMGEHAVVYDYPAIALPFPEANVTVNVSLSKGNESWLDSAYYRGPISNMPDELSNLYTAIDTTIKSFDLPNQPLNIVVNSSIPAGRGMGSSAAVAVALVRALCSYYNQTISNYQLQLIVNQAEVIAHDSTSGIDTLVSSTNQAVIYQKSQKPKAFTFNLEAELIVADSGMVGQTKKAVSHVKRLIKSKPLLIDEVMQSIGQFVDYALEAIQSKDIVSLGRLMTYNHHYLSQLEISHPRLDRIISASWLAGALGAKLSGGGLGGCVIALSPDTETSQQIRQAMHEAGAIQTWLLSLQTI